MQTTVQNERSVRLGSGVLKLDGINVGLLKDAKFTADVSTIQIKADNGKLPPKKKVQSAVFTAELFEISIANLQKVDGTGTVTTTDGTPVAVVDEKLSGFVAGSSYPLANRNADGTVVTAATIKAGGTALVAGTDYNLVVIDGVSFVHAITTKTGEILAGYTYTPTVSKTYTVKDMAYLMSYHELTFENTDENDKKFSIVIPEAYSSGSLEIGFKSDDDISETMTLPISFTANPTFNKTLFKIVDEQAVA